MLVVLDGIGSDVDQNLAQALSRIAELEARLDAMEALKDLESEQDED